MKAIVLKFGLISAAILTLLSVPLWLLGPENLDHGALIGYSAMILSFIAVFVGIRSYRDNVGGGTVTFGRAFRVGILITLITCAVYVIVWQIVYWGFMPDFIEKYAAASIEKMRAAGATAAELAKARKDMAKFVALYRNPLFNAGITFLEVFPVGLIVTLVSAAILRRRIPEAGTS